MDCAKIGKLILRLRKEKGLTQQDIAEALNITNKTISKWECGLGCPDITLWNDLSVILGIDMSQLMEGEIVKNRPDPGNINKIKFYVCPSCNNILFGTGSASISCCGRKLDAVSAKEGNKTEVKCEDSDGGYFITLDHPMMRDHYILFAAYVKNDRVIIQRMYPEQEASFRLPMNKGGRLFVYCVKHGFSECNLKF